MAIPEGMPWSEHTLCATSQKPPRGAARAPLFRTSWGSQEQMLPTGRRWVQSSRWPVLADPRLLPVVNGVRRGPMGTTPEFSSRYLTRQNQLLVGGSACRIKSLPGDIGVFDRCRRCTTWLLRRASATDFGSGATRPEWASESPQLDFLEATCQWLSRAAFRPSRASRISERASPGKSVPWWWTRGRCRQLGVSPLGVAGGTG